jgi:hypothetical protein
MRAFGNVLQLSTSESGDAIVEIPARKDTYLRLANSAMCLSENPCKKVSVTFFLAYGPCRVGST